MSARETGNAASTPFGALVQHARRALAATGGGTLSIDGLHTDTGGDPRPGTGDEVEVLLYEEDGEPRFLCEAGSAVARAAGRGRDAVLDVGCCRRSGCRREVRFAGRLRLLDTDDVDGVPVHVVGLALTAVTVRQPGLADTDLPLACYRRTPTGAASVGPNSSGSAHAESLGAYAERVVRHTNHAHAGALRAAAAELAGTTEDRIIAAEISDLSDQGFTVHWIGGDGAHSCPVSFPRVARSPGELAVLLRTALTGA